MIPPLWDLNELLDPRMYLPRIDPLLVSIVVRYFRWGTPAVDVGKTALTLPDDVEALNEAVGEPFASPGVTDTSIEPEEVERSTRSKRS